MYKISGALVLVCILGQFAIAQAAPDNGTAALPAAGQNTAQPAAPQNTNSTNPAPAAVTEPPKTLPVPDLNENDETDKIYTSKPLTVKPDSGNKAIESPPNSIDVQKIIQYSSNSSLEYTRRGMYYEEQQDYKSALEDYTKAIELAPGRSELLIRRAACYEALNEYPLAVRDLTETLGMRPYRAEIYASRGKIYAKMNKDDLAIWDFDKAVELKPLKPDFYTDRGDFYKSRKKEDYAKRDYAAAAELYAYTADNFKAAKMWREAIREYDKAIAKNPDKAEFKQARKFCMDELEKELKAAEEEAKKAEEEARRKSRQTDKSRMLPKESLMR